MEGYKGLTNTVSAMQKLNFSGNIIPRTWRHWIKRENGKVHHTAIDVLAELIYWYRPIEVVDEKTGNVVEWRKKFKADKLQKSYQDLSDSLGHTKRQSMAAVKWLEAKGYISTEFRHFSWGSNILYIDIDPQVIQTVTFNIPKDPKNLNPKQNLKPEPKENSKPEPIADQNLPADPSDIKTSDTHPSNNETSDSPTPESEIPHNETSDHPTLERDTYTENTHREHNREHLHQEGESEKEKKSDLDLGLNLKSESAPSNQSNFSNHKCWGFDDEGLKLNENSTTAQPSAEKAKAIGLNESDKKEGARAGVSVAAGGKSKLEILNEMLGTVSGDRLSGAFVNECRSGALLPWLDNRLMPDSKFAMWLGSTWNFDDDKNPSNSEILRKANGYICKALHSADKLRKILCEWDAYQLHLTELNEAANVKSSDISAEAMAVIQGKSNGRYKSLDVFEPKPWNPGDPIMLDEDEWAIPKNASREFVEGLRADAALRREAHEWYELIEKIKSNIEASKPLAAKAFLDNLRMHVYNSYIEANQKSKTEPRNKYFDKNKIIETFRFAYDAGYKSSVPAEVHRFCGRVH
jgi:hypothetical protein